SSLFASFLDTASLNALIQTCHRLYTVLDPEFQARITAELGKRILLWAAKESKPHVVSKLLAPPHLVNPNEAPGSRSGSLTALHAAVQAGSTEIVAMLLAGGADPRSVSGIDNFQPLHLAVFDDWLEILGLLLDHGAPINQPYGYKVPETALHHACAVGRFETVRVLLERGADTECVGEYGTALGYALRARRLEVMGMLLEHGAKAEAAVPLNSGWIRDDSYGHTPPYRANLLYLAMGLTHPQGEDSSEPPSTEGRAEFMAMLLAYGASKEAAMKTVLEYLTPLADAADKTEEQFLEMGIDDNHR
ncbi:ankyrin repeat-containing domain protein, partial [Roridomyces roridus]